MTIISDNLQQVRGRIRAACEAAGRRADAVQLLAVSKTMAADAVQAAFEAGQTAFGENYIQEAVGKIQALRTLPITWHCVGPVQSNKTRLVAEHFDWIHTLDRLKIAERLSEQRPAGLPPLQVLIQVNVDGGANKSGLPPHDALALAQAVSQLPRLQLRGLMCIPEPAANSIANYAALTGTCALFDRLKSLAGDFAAESVNFDTLSMGMTADLEAAIACGSTMVRVGTAIFGGRPAKAY